MRGEKIKVLSGRKREEILGVKIGEILGVTSSDLGEKSETCGH